MDGDRREERGWKRSGGLTPMTSNSPQDLALIPSGPPINSAITGSPSRAPRGESATGLRLGAIGAVAKRKAAGEIVDPEETTAALLAALPQASRCLLLVHCVERIDAKFGWDGEVAYRRRCDEEGRMLPLADADRSEALALIAPYLKRAQDHTIVTELVRLRNSCKTRPEEQNDATLTMRILAEECAEYPADVAVWAIREWAKREVFTPSLAELRDGLQRAARTRKSLVRALSIQRHEREGA